MFFSRRSKATKPTCIRRLLVVEDDALLAFDHEHALSNAGYTVVATVNCGESAAAALVEYDVDAIILDLNLAGKIPGTDVARIAHDRGVLVLLVSGDPPGAAASFAAAHIAKPLATGAVVAGLRVIEAQQCRGEDARPIAGMTLLGARPSM